MFGGRSSAGSLNEVWSLNLNTNQWENITPMSGSMPAVRITANAVYDSLLNRMIIWSGQGTQLYNDIWAFDLSNNSWQQLWADGNVAGAPLKRYGTASVFDPVNRRLVNFAGFTTSGRFEDTWSFQVDNMQWTERTNLFQPEMRCLHSGYITPGKTEMIIFGGQHNGALDDIWSLNLNSFIWTNITPAVKPAGRWFSPIICTNSKSIVIFGGENSQGILGDLWKYSIDSMKWESVIQGAVTPPARWGHISVYVPASDKMIIFGGADPLYRNDAWMFTNIGSVGINTVSSEIPDNFRLNQNYPNPFNPSTNITYQLKTGSFVNLKVFDILGKEILTLVNQKQNAGSYSVEFSAGSIPSGVYFYRLQAEGFSDVKRMILMK
jgi:hypothetical protein